MTVDLEIARSLRPSPARCFALWKDLAILKQWFGPRCREGHDFKATEVDWPMQVGADWRIALRSVRDAEIVMAGKMLEIEEPSLLRFSFHWVNEGARGPRTEVTIRFDAEGSGTRLHFIHAGLADAAQKADHLKGWTSFIDRFEEAVEGTMA
ncbi:MAG: SRPBCC family protein [Pseudorhodobacter sp.]